MPDNQTVHEVKVEGTESAIAKFEALAQAKEKAASAGGFSGVSGVASPRSSYYDFSGAPAAPGTTGNPQSNQGAMTVVGGTQSYGGNGGSVNAAALTVYTPQVVIYAQNVQQAGVGGLTTSVASPGSAGYTSPGGGAPAAPGTVGTPGNTGGFMGMVQNFLGRPMPGSGNSPWGGASIGDMLGAGVNTGSLGGLAQTFMNALPGIGAVTLAANTMSGVAHAAYAGSQPGYGVETSMLTAAASGQYINPAQAAAMQRAAVIRGENEYWRGMVGLVGWIPGASLAYESNYGRDRDRQAAIEEARGANDSRSLMAGALLGHSKQYGDDPYGEASFNLLLEGSNFGRGGASVGDRFNFQRLVARNGGNLSAASAYGSDLVQFASQAQYGLLPSLLDGSLDLNSPQLSAMMVQAAAESGNFSALGRAYKGNRSSVPQSAFDLAGRVAGLNVNSSIASSGLRYNQANTSLIAALGASTGQRADAMEQGDTYLGRLQGYTDEQIAISRDPLRVAELTAQRQQILSQRESNRTAALALRYQGRFELNSADMSSYGTASQIAQFGNDPSQVTAMMGQQGDLYGEQAGLYGEMSQNMRFSPEQRAQYAAQAYAARYQSTIGNQRQIGQFNLGLQQGQIGINSAVVGAGISQAGLFGGIQSIYNAQIAQVGITQQEIGSVRGQMAGEYGPTTMQERQELQKRLTELLQQETIAREGAVRGLGQMQVALASTVHGIAGTQQQRAYITGSGGLEGFGYASSTSAAASGVASAAASRVAMLRSRGIAEDNPEMQSALLQMEQAQTGAAQSEVSATQVPFSLGLRQDSSRQQFHLQMLSLIPGSYGSMRTMLGKQMGTQEQMAGEITQRRDAHRAQYGGHLPEHLEHEYEQQLQQVAVQQGQTFQQLSYGWESRLQSQMLGTPGSMSFISPSLSFRAAVGAGVSNPHMGMGAGEVPFFLKQAMLSSSIAGATGTPEGFGVTALTGAHEGVGAGAMPQAIRTALDGVRLVLEIPLPGGGHTSTITTLKSTAQDTSPAAVIESSRRHMTAPHQ